MGVDCLIKLPEGARIRDVGEAIGILAGNQPSKVSSRGGSGWYLKVENVVVEGILPIPECARIIFPYLGEKHLVLFHFEPSDGGRLLMPRSTPFWLAVGHELIHLFGGTLSYDDYDNSIDESVDVDYNINPEDGQEWLDWQERMFNVKPLTKMDIDRYREHAAYPED